MSEISAEISAKFRFSVEIDKISPPKFRFSDFFLLFFDSKNLKKVLLEGFEPTQNAWKWHPPATKPFIALIIYNANFFYILLLFICS